MGPQDVDPARQGLDWMSAASSRDTLGQGIAWHSSQHSADTAALDRVVRAPRHIAILGRFEPCSGELGQFWTVLAKSAQGIAGDADVVVNIGPSMVQLRPQAREPQAGGTRAPT